MKMKILFAIGVAAVAVTANAATQTQLKEKMASLIQNKGLWCGQVKDIVPTIFGNSPNHKSFHVLCDDGEQAVDYTVTISRDHYTVEE
ncbi:hypothetical protein [Salinisphaera hydrothermalis]|uniref:hypothetical protein n=1 Tax=Salinisphaera hydrothermalis TaxID=563188 RepID=UPI0033423DB8